MNICVTGTGYVGLVTGTCLAEIGHRVVCLDNDENKSQSLKAGKMPIYEPHLEDLVRSNRERGRLSFTADFGMAFRDAQGIFICVGTPPLENGEADLSSVEKVVREILPLRLLQTGHREKHRARADRGVCIPDPADILPGQEGPL